MHRAIPVSNKFLSKKWDEMSQAVHHEKLRSMRALVDSATPVSFPHSAKKAKKEQLMEDRYTEIERENRLLLEKMSTIMQNHPSRERNTRKKSLNRESRKRELVKITMENQAILRRLQDRQPSYSIHKWEGERRRTERLLQNICEYPYQLGVTSYIEEGNTRRRFGSVESRVASRQDIGSAPMTRNAQVRKPGSTTAGERPRKLAPISKDESREVVFKRGLNINEKYFLIEVSERPGLLTITAFDIESPDSYNLEMSSKEALELMGEEKAYDRLVSMLSFEKGELMLVDKRAEEVSKQPSSNKKPKVKPSPVSRKTPVHVESRTPEARRLDQNPQFYKQKESTPIPQTKPAQASPSLEAQRTPSDSKPEFPENPALENKESPSFPGSAKPDIPSHETPKETLAEADQETSLRKSSEDTKKPVEDIRQNPAEMRVDSPDVDETHHGEAPASVEAIITQAENAPKEEDFRLEESASDENQPKMDIPHVDEPEMSLEAMPKAEETHIEESAPGQEEVPNPESIVKVGDEEKTETLHVEETAPMIESVPADVDPGHEVQAVDAVPEIEQTDQIGSIPPNVELKDGKIDQPILLADQEKIDDIEATHPQVLAEESKETEEKHAFEQVETVQKEEKPIIEIQSLKQELSEHVEVDQTYAPEQPSTERKTEEFHDPKQTISEEKGEPQSPQHDAESDGNLGASPDPASLNLAGPPQNEASSNPVPDQVPERSQEPVSNPAEIPGAQTDEIARSFPAEASSPPSEKSIGDVEMQKADNIRPDFDSLEAAGKVQSASE